MRKMNIFLLLCFFIYTGCSHFKGFDATASGKRADNAIAERWGIRIEGVRLSPEGYMFDFSYRVLDPSRAASITGRRYRPYLIHEATGIRLVPPYLEIAGPKTQPEDYPEPLDGRTCFVFFANPGRLVKQGDKVTVVIGDFTARSIPVE